MRQGCVRSAAHSLPTRPELLMPLTKNDKADKFPCKNWQSRPIFLQKIDNLKFETKKWQHGHTSAKIDKLDTFASAEHCHAMHTHTKFLEIFLQTKLSEVWEAWIYYFMGVLQCNVWINSFVLVYSLAYLVVPNTEEQFSDPFRGLSKIWQLFQDPTII